MYTSDSSAPNGRNDTLVRNYDNIHAFIFTDQIHQFLPVPCSTSMQVSKLDLTGEPNQVELYQ